MRSSTASAQARPHSRPHTSRCGRKTSLAVVSGRATVASSLADRYGWICGSGAGGFSCGKLGPHGTVRPYKPGQPTIDAEAVSPPAAVAKHPPCTKKAIAAGLRRGANKIPGAPIEGFRCAGRWAFAVVLDGVDDVPALFRAQGTRWVTVDREKPCNDHVVPKKIYVAACLSS